MNPILFSLLILLAVVVLGALVNHLSQSAGPEFANIAEGTHECAITKKADAVISTRFLLGKDGDDDDSIAVCGASDIPLGVITDEATAIDDRVAVQLLGHGPTQRMVASEAITVGEHVYTAASGKVQDLPAGAGTYYEVGLALTPAAADGDIIEVASCVARATVVS